jgi:hypothetical protein
MDREQIYLAHPIITYNTMIETKAIKIIERYFPDTKILNPAKHQNISHSPSMAIYKLFVESCDILVYTDIAGFITSGVAEEIEMALEKGIDIYRLDWREGKLTKVNRPRGYILNRRKTNQLYKLIRKHHLDEAEIEYLIEQYRKRVGANIDRWMAQKLALQGLRPRKQKEEEIPLNPLEKHYHWWQEPDYTQIPIDNKKLTEIIMEKMSENKATNIGELLRKLGVKNFETSYHFIYRIVKNLVKQPTTKGLKRLCNQLKTPYIELEKRKIFTRHNFPYNLADPALWKVATHILNEGHIETDYNVGYVNKDPVLHWYFHKAVKEAQGTPKGPDKDKQKLLFESYADVLTGRRLEIIGIPRGRKALNEPTIDLSKMPNKIWKYHVKTTLTEDGSASLGLARGKWPLISIELERVVDITRYIPKDIISVFNPGDYRIGMISREMPKLLDIIKKHPPRVLKLELNEFIRRHSNQLSPMDKPVIYVWSIHVSKNYDVTAEWKLFTKKHSIVDIIAREYGMLPYTYKDIVFKKYYDFYVKYRGKAITEETRNEYEELIKKYNYKGIGERWINKKMKEFFGDKS